MVEFHPAADSEVTDAATYYDLRREGLGDIFLQSLHRAVEAVEHAPADQPPWLFQGIPDGVRHSLVRGFHHSVVFIVEPRLYIAAVRHHAQHPTQWVERLHDV